MTTILRGLLPIFELSSRNYLILYFGKLRSLQTIEKACLHSIGSSPVSIFLKPPSAIYYATQRKTFPIRRQLRPKLKEPNRIQAQLVLVIIQIQARKTKQGTRTAPTPKQILSRPPSPQWSVLASSPVSPHLRLELRVSDRIYNAFKLSLNDINL